MRIVQLVENLERGGLERMAVDLAFALKAAGHELSIYCLFDPGALAPEAEAGGVSVRPFHKPAGFHLPTLLAMARQLRKDRVQVIHGHNSGVHHYAAVAAKLAGVPAVVNTRHGPRSSTGAAFNERWFKLVMPWTSHVAYVSEEARQYLARVSGVPIRNSSVVYNGISLERFLPHPASPGSRLPALRFGTLGRMVPVKGHSVLLDAFATVRRELPEAELRIVGGGILQPELEAQVRRLALEACVSIEPSTPKTPEILASLDVFVFPSLSEGLPLVILEAMAAGLPIVSTRVGGVPEVAPEGEVAWYCEPGDSAALARVMLEAAASGELRARGERARSLAQERFSREQMTATYLRIYEAALQRSAG